MRSLKKVHGFTLTEDHLTLLKNAYVRWDDCETGAPAIDPKRPYGNSSVAHDIAFLLGHELDRNGELSASDEEQLLALHRETETALQIVLQHGPVAGDYEQANEYSSEWVRASFNAPQEP